MDVMLSLFGPTAHGEDFAAIAANVRKAGANQLLLFTSLYHGYRLIQPRYPNKAIYSLETDRVFYRPDPAAYADCPIKPQQSIDAPDADWVEGLSKACAAEGLEFFPLIPMCAGERLVQDHPELAVTNMYGSRDRLFMCYNNPVMRQYRLAMVRDVVGRYDMAGVLLDKIPQIMLEQYAFSGIFDAPLRTVGSFCFCEHCRKAAATHNLDLDEVRSVCMEVARRSLNIPPHIIASQADQVCGDSEVPLLLLEQPVIYRMLEFRFASAVRFVADVRELVKKLKPPLPLHAAFVPPCHMGHDATSPRSWLTIQSYQKYAHVLDAIMCVVHWPADVVRFETQRAVDSAAGKTRVYTSMRLYGATRPEEVPGLIEAALAGGSRGVSFLGYDVAGGECLAALGRYVMDAKKSKR